MYDIIKVLTIVDQHGDGGLRRISDPLKRARKLSNSFMKYGMLLVIIGVIVAAIGHYVPFLKALKYVSLVFFYLGQFAAIISLGIEPVVGCWSLKNLKRDELSALSDEIQRNARLSEKLSNFSNDTIEFVISCLQQKIEHGERRIKLFFGKNTTFIALMSIGYSLLAHFDVLNWLPSLFSHPFSATDFFKVCIVLILALFFGFLLGFFMLKKSINRYQRKISDLNFCLKYRELRVR